MVCGASRCQIATARSENGSDQRLVSRLIHSRARTAKFENCRCHPIRRNGHSRRHSSRSRRSTGGRGAADRSVPDNLARTIRQLVEWRGRGWLQQLQLFRADVSGFCFRLLCGAAHRAETATAVHTKRLRAKPRRCNSFRGTFEKMTNGVHGNSPGPLDR